MFHQLIQHKRDLPVVAGVAFTYGRVLRNIRGDELEGKVKSVRNGVKSSSSLT